MTFRLGAKSESELVGVEGGIVLCARRAITTTKQDFGVYEGLRNLERQKKLVLAGASRTLDSYHLPDPKGIGHALDLLAYVEGRLQWQPPLSNVVAIAMREASLTLGVPLTWGRVWDRLLGELDPDDLERERFLYVQRYQVTHPPRLVNGKLKAQFPLDDPPHFQGLRLATKVRAA